MADAGELDYEGVLALYLDVARVFEPVGVEEAADLLRRQSRPRLTIEAALSLVEMRRVEFDHGGHGLPRMIAATPSGWLRIQRMMASSKLTEPVATLA